MRDFYAPTGPGPLDQADGLRRLFGGTRQRVVPLAANPHVAFAGVALERATAALSERGHQVLVVDAADDAPVPAEIARIDLPLAIERLSPTVGYLAARGLPLAHVDTRGSASGFLDLLAEAAPQADVVLLHANATDLARMFLRRPARPVLLAADHPESVKHAYAACKLLAQRCRLMTFDLLLVADPSSRRLPGIADSLGSCADSFLGAVLRDWTVVDPAAAVDEPVPAGLARLLEAQLGLDEPGRIPPPRAGRAPTLSMNTN